MPENKKDHEKCVKVNIFVKCQDDSWKNEKETNCVEVNIYAECEECKKDKWPCE